VPSLIVALVGPTNAGKSSLAKHWLRRFPSFRHVDDFAPLSEYFEMERLVATSRSAGEFERRLRERSLPWSFVADLVEDYQELATARGWPLLPRFCRHLGGGAMEVADPDVWDEILLRLGRSVDPGADLLIEFARGHDSAYLTALNLPEHEVYQHSLEVLARGLGREMLGRLAILHVAADYPTRRIRNEVRARLTGHHVPVKVMEEVFQREVFHPKQIFPLHDSIQRCTIRVIDHDVPVMTVDNSAQRSPEEQSVFFDLVCELASEYLMRR